jgi:hypothetical protein
LLGEPNNDSPLNGYAAALWDNQAGMQDYKNTLIFVRIQDSCTKEIPRSYWRQVK